MEKRRGRPPGNKIEGMRNGNQDLYDTGRATTLKDAMEMAQAVVREDPDPDPYGFVQEIEQNIDVTILPKLWHVNPDDDIWVKRLKARARRAQVATRYLRGESIADIAKAVKANESTVRKDIGSISLDWRQSYIQDIEILASRDLARLDTMLSKLWKNVDKGDPRAIQVAVEIIRERGAILGYKQGITIDVEQYIRQVAESQGYDPDKAVEFATRISLTFPA